MTRPRGGDEHLPPTSREGSGPTPGRGALAGPESAAEHLRNALMLLDSTLPPDPHGLLSAVRRRVAAALAQLDAGGQ